MSEGAQVKTLGEALIVMDPASSGPLRQVGSFEKHIGGAELNVAVALSRLGHRVGWVGKLGEDEFGAEILARLRGEAVDVSGVSLDPEAPTGLYFKEKRALSKLRAHYYRAGSAASRMRFEDLDLGYLFSGEILHLSGITPALSENCRDLALRLVEAANEQGSLVSFDANVRFRLFRGEDPREVLMPLVERADLLFLSEDEAEFLLGGRRPDAVERARAKLRAETIVVHGRDGAIALGADGVTEAVSFPVEEIDPVGAGDAFVAGYLSGRLRSMGDASCLELANASGACAVTIHGDMESMPFAEEVASLVQGRAAVER